MLLLRGCDPSIVNNSHQNAYQVAVISGNMALAELINHHKPENVVPYRDKPRFNPARRPQSCYSNGTNNAQNASPVNSSDVYDLNDRSKNKHILDEDKRVEAEENDDDDEGEDDSKNEEDNNVDNSSGSDSSTLLPGMTVMAVSDYNSGDPSHLQLRRNDYVLLMHSTHSPPTIASQKLLLGRRCVDGQEGYFPACCIEKIKLHKSHSGDDRVEGRRDMKFKNAQSATLPSRGRRGARKCLLDKVSPLSLDKLFVILVV